MARYDPIRAWFRTPRGRTLIAYHREGTNDWNTLNSCLGEVDEYQIRDRHLTGTVLDIGAHIGGVTLALLLDNPDLHVIAVEPIPENVALLRRNLRVNGVEDRCTVIEGAAGRSGEHVSISYRFECGENELHHAFVGNANTVQADTVEHKTVIYPALGIHDLIDDREVAWTKVDCEGGEWGFLADGGLVHLATIVGEFHPTALPDGTTGSQDRLRALLEPTHAVTFTGPESGPGGFTAVRR